MAFRICKTFDVENGHMLSKHPDKCKFPHGHTRKVEFIIEADDLDQNDMVCDFKVVKECIHEFVMSFDHSLCMNTSDPNYDMMKKAYGDRIIDFVNIDPTTEAMAKVLFLEFKKRLTEYAHRENTRYKVSKHVRLVRVRLWETTTSWAEYFE